MKKRMLPLIAIALLAFASCSQMNEQKYNDTVVNMYSAYSGNMTSKMNAISGNTADKAKMQADVTGMEKTTESCIGVMNSLKPSDEAKDFHQKVLTVFQTVKTDFIPVAKKMVDMSGSQDVDAYNKMITEFNDLSNKLNKVESDAQTAQQVYVSKIGMKIK